MDISRPCQPEKLNRPLLPWPGFDPSFSGHNDRRAIISEWTWLRLRPLSHRGRRINHGQHYKKSVSWWEGVPLLLSIEDSFHCIGVPWKQVSTNRLYCIGGLWRQVLLYMWSLMIGFTVEVVFDDRFYCRGGLWWQVLLYRWSLTTGFIVEVVLEDRFYCRGGPWRQVLL